MIKRSIFCSSVFLIFAWITPGNTDEHFPFLAEVSKESVNVRTGPNTNFEKIDKLSKGTQVVVLGRSYEWYKVQPLPTTKEYIRSDYLKINAGVGVVLGNNVNVRSAASSDAASLGEVKEGTVVKVIDIVPVTPPVQKNGNIGWCLIAPVAGTAAWVHQDFLKEISGQVPASLLVPAFETPSSLPIAGQAGIDKEPQIAPSAGVSPWVTLRGTVEALVQSPQGDVHYEIVLGDKSVYFLQDIPQISYFCNTVVDVEGAITPDPPSHAEDSFKSQKKLMYPLLHINKIEFVL